jgi:hypothetical protein
MICDVMSGAAGLAILMSRNHAKSVSQSHRYYFLNKCGSLAGYQRMTRRMPKATVPRRCQFLDLRKPDNLMPNQKIDQKH